MDFSLASKFCLLVLMSINICLCQDEQCCGTPKLDEILANQQEQKDKLQEITDMQTRDRQVLDSLLGAIQGFAQAAGGLAGQPGQGIAEQTTAFLQAQLASIMALAEGLTAIQPLISNMECNSTQHGEPSVRTCPSSFREFNNSCYFFGVMAVERSQAKAACVQMGANLTTVNTYAEDQYITEILRSLPETSSLKGYWTGGSDIRSEGRWIWDETQEEMTYSQWVSGEGGRVTYRNYWRRPENNEDCHIYWEADNLRWHDYMCDRPAGFICERPL